MRRLWYSAHMENRQLNENQLSDEYPYYCAGAPLLFFPNSFCETNGSSRAYIKHKKAEQSHKGQLETGLLWNGPNHLMAGAWRSPIDDLDFPVGFETPENGVVCMARIPDRWRGREMMVF